MEKLWGTNATIFSLQLLGYYASKNSFLSNGSAAIFEVIIAAGIAVAAGLFVAVGQDLYKGVNNLTIVLLAAASAVTQLPRGLIPNDDIAVIGAFTCILFAVVLERREDESIVSSYVAAIPGMGVFLGGAILLYRKWQDFRVTAGWA